MDIEFEPDLSTCIHTLAKREHDQALKQLLDSEDEDAGLRERVETLRMFLESTDFVKLRSQYEPHLVHGKRVKFTLRAAGNTIEYGCDVT